MWADKPVRPGEPHSHEWNEGLSAGDDPRVVARGQHRASWGSCIFERSGFHPNGAGFLDFSLLTGKLTGNFADSDPALPFLVVGKRVNSMAYVKIPCATEQGIFERVSGNLDPRARGLTGIRRLGSSRSP
jgi:hypothetical protein